MSKSTMSTPITLDRSITHSPTHTILVGGISPISPIGLMPSYASNEFEIATLISKTTLPIKSTSEIQFRDNDREYAFGTTKAR